MAKNQMGGIAVAVLIVAIILAIIVSVPTWLIDFLLVINISLALIILLNSLYAKDALSMSVFPTLLLFTTIYRLALNLSSTRLILGKGYAGDVIDNFANFVAQDNIVVGFVAFILITIVQFLVITKGSERVSEVAARFTLDAMPGKQMAIDADLNAGLINEHDAKERRRKIQREADFYGAMDGASKFVKNDSIVGILTTIVNIVGGFIIGVAMNHEAFGDALDKYTRLSIGDGLVSQIPSLLISISTGIIVTRAAADDELSNDLIKQLFYKPVIMYIAAGGCVIMGFMLDPLPFILLAIVLVFVGIKLKGDESKLIKQEEQQFEEEEIQEIRKPENVISLLQVDPIELEFGYGVIPLADVNQGGDLLDRVVMIRRQLAIELGMIVPIIRLRDNIQLSPNQYVVKIKGVDIASGDLMLDHYMAMNPGIAENEIDGIPTVEPAFGLPAVWITEKQRDRAEMLGYTVVDTPSVIATHLTEVIKKHAHELLGRQDVQTLIENVKETYPAIVDELTPKLLSIGEIQKVLANLLMEGVSIRDMVTILETLADYAPITRESDMLTEYVRQALGRMITRTFITPDNNSVLTLDPELEQTIMNSVQKTEAGSYLALEPNVTNGILKNLAKQAEKILQLGKQPIIVSSPIVRLYFKRMAEQAVPGIVVLSYSELDPTIEVESLGIVGL